MEEGDGDRAVCDVHVIKPARRSAKDFGIEIRKTLLAQFLSNHQSPEPIELDRRRSDGEGSDRAPSINMQGVQEHNSTLGLRI